MLVQRPIRIFMALIASCLIFNACDDDDDDGTGPSNQASVRFVNATTGGTGSLAFTIGNNAPGSPIDYQRFGTCQELAPGNTSFSIAQPGSATPLITIPVQDLSAGSNYTIITTGSVATPNFLFLKDTYTTPPSGRARLRVINATAVTSPFDVYVSQPGVPLGTANLSAVGFNTPRDFLDVPSGATQVRVTIPLSQTILGTSANFTLNSGEIRTLVFTPTATVGGTFSSFLTTQCL